MKNFLNGFKNFKNTMNSVNEAGGVTSFVGDMLKQKLKVWLAGVFVSVIPFLIPFFAIIIILAVVAAPFMSFFGGNKARLDDFGREIRSPELQAFVDNIEKRKEYWEDNGVSIDMNLVLAFLYYGNPDAANIDCTQENLEDCFEEKKVNYKALEKEAIELIDNMVVKVTIFVCTERINVRKNQCKVVEEKLPNGQIEYSIGDCEVTLTSFDQEQKVCGPNQEACKSTCFSFTKPQIFEDKTICPKDEVACGLSKTMSFTTSTKDIYMLKTKSEYDEWIKENYIEDKLARVKVSVPNDQSKEEFIGGVIDEVYLIRNTFSDRDLTFLLGETVSGAGRAGSIPEEIIDILVSPLGTQPCRQTACFGFYTPNNCTSHAGVDIGNNGGSPNLYSVAPGTIIGIVKGSGNCSPNWNASPICPRNVCIATVVTIKHEAMVEDRIVTFYSKYVHLDSIASNLTVGSSVASGEFIGVMGNTGCSTATHLHFELLSGEKKTYNPEEFLLRKGCTPYQNNPNLCNQARSVCSGGRW